MTCCKRALHFVLTNMIHVNVSSLTKGADQTSQCRRFKRTPVVFLFSVPVETSHLEGGEFSCSSSSLHLCRAACGSADIPILLHAHAILLKRAVNLKRKRGSPHKQESLSSPYCGRSHHVTQISHSRKTWGLGRRGPAPVLPLHDGTDLF